MPKIGILLPGSTLYPSIGIDFLLGLKSHLSFYNETNVELVVFPIGYGLKEREIYAQAEKWLLSDNVDVVICYAEDRLAQILSPLLMAMNKLLLITNMGAQYPYSKSIIPHTIFHSMNDCLHSFLSGKLAGTKVDAEKNAIVATSFYDGGYQHCHAMTNGFISEGGNVTFNFISQFQKKLFDIKPLADFITNHKDVDTLLCIYSGDMAKLFFEQIFPLQNLFGLKLIGSPMMFDDSPGDFEINKLSVPAISGYTGWVESLSNIENQKFLTYFSAENNKRASIFSLQGWEAGSIVMAYLDYRLTTSSVADTLDKFRTVPVVSPRGLLKLDTSNHLLGPAYLVSASYDTGVVIEDVLEDVSTARQEMIKHIPDTGFSTWQNTYLCI